jgi:plasma kallikrein
VPYYQCMETDGAGIFNIRSDFDESSVPCKSLRKCCETANINTEQPMVEMSESCGYRNVKGLGHFSFAKQKESQYGEFPWTIAVLKKISIDDEVISLFMGGGSLVHPQVVLTTAHNVNDTNPNDLIVRGGEWNTMTTDEMFMHQERDVQGIVRHKDFKRNNLHNDIMLMFLVKKFDLAPHVNTICLPQPSYRNHGENCFVAGWGKDQVRISLGENQLMIL